MYLPSYSDSKTCILAIQRPVRSACKKNTKERGRKGGFWDCSSSDEIRTIVAM